MFETATSAAASEPEGARRDDDAAGDGGPFWILACAVLAAGSYLLARFIQLGPVPGPWAYWPIHGVLCGVLFRRPTREWWRLGLAAATAQVLTIYLVRGDLAGGATVGGALSGAIQATLGASILRRTGATENPMGRPRDFAWFLIGAVCLVPLLISPFSALGYAAGLHLPFRDAWWPLFVGNSLSLLLFTPLFAQRWRRTPGQPLSWAAGSGEVLLSQACILLLVGLSFGGPEHWLRYVALPYAMFPLLAWSALRCGPRWTSLSIAGTATLSAFFTARGTGPFAAAGAGLDQRVLQWQAFIAFITFTALLLCALTDQRRRAFEALRLQTAIQEAIFDSADTLIGLKDLDGRFVLVNRATELLLDQPRAQLLGRRPREFLPPGDAVRLEQHDRRALERGEALTFEETFASRGVRRHFVMTRFPVRDPEGKVRYVGTIGRDDTVEHELAGRLQRAARVEVIGQLAAGLAHDLNNLLIVIVGNAGLLRERPDLPLEEQALLRDLIDAARRATNLTGRLLSVGRQPVGPRLALDVDQSLRALLPLLRALVRGNIDLATELKAPGAAVIADAGELEQIALNLVSNARDAIADAGRISIATEIVGRAAVPVGSDSSAADRWLRMRVSDNGAGMSAETMARLFEPFFTTKGMAEGTGLGLYTTSLLVRKAGGVIHAVSEPGQETSFVVDLPLAGQARAGA